MACPARTARIGKAGSSAKGRKGETRECSAEASSRAAESGGATQGLARAEGAAESDRETAQKDNELGGQ
eukprot:1268069-Pyramimonas_sp.AAC.1